MGPESARAQEVRAISLTSCADTSMDAALVDETVRLEVDADDFAQNGATRADKFAKAVTGPAMASVSEVGARACWHIEDVLAAYARPFDHGLPVVLYESSASRRDTTPATPFSGHPA